MWEMRMITSTSSMLPFSMCCYVKLKPQEIHVKEEHAYMYIGIYLYIFMFAISRVLCLDENLHVIKNCGHVFLLEQHFFKFSSDFSFLLF